MIEGSLEEMDNSTGVVIPIMMDCDKDDDFMTGIDKIDNDIPILPLRNMVLFPGVATPVVVGRVKSMRLIKDSSQKKKLIGVVCQKDTETEDPKFTDMFHIGVVAEILRVLEMPDGTTTIVLQGKKRFLLHEIIETEPFLMGHISLMDDNLPRKTDREFEALVSTIKDLIIKMLIASEDPPRELIFSVRKNKNLH